MNNAARMRRAETRCSSGPARRRQTQQRLSGRADVELHSRLRALESTIGVASHSTVNHGRSRLTRVACKAVEPTIDRETISKPMNHVSETAEEFDVRGTRAEQLHDEYALRNYAKPSGVVLTRGEGVVVYDSAGRSYLDFTAGIAVNALGHSHPAWVAAVQEQAALLAHVSNLFHSEQGPQLMSRLSHSVGGLGGRVFLCNSGTEANEAAMKFARKWKSMKLAEQREAAGMNFIAKAWTSIKGIRKISGKEIVAFTGGFHGRTMGALSLTSNPKYREPFEPNLPGTRFAEFNNLDSAKKAIKKGRTCAVFVEPVQGEGGINIPDASFIIGLRKLCDEAGALLIFDEVQCGLGRTGWLYAHEKFGVCPDIITLAKPLAGGLPIGATIMTEDVARSINPGDHGSTFAGGPVVCSAALAVLDILESPGFLEHVEDMGKILKEKVVNGAIGKRQDFVEYRGMGLLAGIEMNMPVGTMIEIARKKGLLVCSAGKGNVVRLVPPLIVTKDEIERAVNILEEALIESTGAT